MLLYWIAFYGMVLLVIVVHELGHLIAARWCGIHVLNISIGLGPQIFGFTDQYGTRWRVGSLPIAGAIRIPRQKAGSQQGSPIERVAAKDVKQRAAIYAAGPTCSLLFAAVVWEITLTVFHSDLATAFTKLEANIAMLAAGLSALNGLFNLLPLPPLDGGGLLFLGIEAFRGRPVSDHIQVAVSRIGFVVITIATVAMLVYVGSLNSFI
jgi:membrane-associated protease RseP (regulator of RpoE activity)